MTVSRYFQLTTSDSSLSRKFRVMQSGYNPVYEKSQSVKKTLNGKYDVSQGAIYIRHEYVIKVYAEDPDDGYGTKDELMYFFSLNNPNGTPSNKLTFVDNFGNSFIVSISGDTSPTPLGVSLEGPAAPFIMKLTFLFLEEVEDGPS